MSIGSSLLLIAAGAILKWAVTAHIKGFDIQTAGTVLLVIGIVALPLALLYTFWWGPQRVEERRVVRRDPTDRDVY
jgi:vacuolar-type H+-ATPase subunit I/STV1